MRHGVCGHLYARDTLERTFKSKLIGNAKTDTIGAYLLEQLLRVT
jgi:hypothetical protein